MSLLSARRVSQFVGPAGPAGPAGPPGPSGGGTGPAGPSGQNAFTTLTSSFTQPSIGSNVTATVGNTAWMAVGMAAFVENGGAYTVASITDSLHVVLTNTGAAGNAAGGTVIPSLSKVSSTGRNGAVAPPVLFAALSTSIPVGSRAVMFLDGHTSVADGGGGEFIWDASSTASPDGGVTAQVTGVATGRWRRRESVNSSRAEAHWFGGKPNGRFFNSSDGKLYQDSGFVTLASDDAIKLRNARDYLNGLGVSGTRHLHLCEGNWSMQTVETSGSDRVFCMLSSNMTVTGEGPSTVVHVPGGTTTGSTGYSAVFGQWPGRITATSISNVLVADMIFDHNALYNRWGGANFNTATVPQSQQSATAVGIPVGDNCEVRNITIRNFNGTFAVSMGTYGDPQLATNMRCLNVHLENVGADPNQGDTSMLAFGATNLSVRGCTVDAGRNIGAGIVGCANNGSGLIRVTTAAAHNLYSTDYNGTQQMVVIRDVVGTTEANGYWAVSVVDATHFDLKIQNADGSTLSNSAFVHAYVSGGTIDGCNTLTFIEAHPVGGIIADNSGRGCGIGIILAGDAHPTFDCTVHDNRFDAFINGIVLENQITQIDVHDNVVAARQGNSKTSGESGIDAFALDTYGALTDLKIHHNKCSLTLGVGTTLITAGGGGATQGSSGYGVVGNFNKVRIEDNESSGFGTNGCGYRRSAQTGIKNELVFERNRSYNGPLKGIEIQGDPGDSVAMTGLRIVENKAFDDRGGGSTLVNGWTINQLKLPAADAVVSENVTSGNTGSAFFVDNSTFGTVTFAARAFGNVNLDLYDAHGNERINPDATTTLMGIRGLFVHSSLDQTATETRNDAFDQASTVGATSATFVSAATQFDGSGFEVSQADVVILAQDGTGDVAAYRHKLTIRTNGSGYAIVDNYAIGTDYVDTALAASTVAFTIDGTGHLVATVTGVAGKTLTWGCRMRFDSFLGS